MRVTFLLLRRGYVRNFASCIEGLLANGHEVHLGFDMPEHSPTGIELHNDDLILANVIQEYIPGGVAPRGGRRGRVLVVGVLGGIATKRIGHELCQSGLD